jgi:hypothetical protein
MRNTTGTSIGLVNYVWRRRQRPGESEARMVVRVFIYCRLSREGGRSVERQEQDGKRLAEQRGWEIVEVFKEWVSASEFSKAARKE